ncbi:phenylacetate--CoA ligase family protein [Ramlibacter sp. 2FC]|uniref:phenylacetate--CoA ligase family protein n=1 Tax=Ramlibacter sp. 2FC TaxID=2502188 RepID=UPI0010F8C05C|nr:phenylacetate--CoA ligase family protein [Ramlibacter sp. 2FC]
MRLRTLRYAQGWLSALVAYPAAEHIEKRDIRTKLNVLRKHYRKPFAQRKQIAQQHLVETLVFAGEKVPYYRDLFSRHRFDARKVAADVRYLNDLPYLTKDIIREQGSRLFSRPLEGLRHHVMKTGGSTGLSCHIHYDQDGIDHAAAVTLFCRERIGKAKHKFELHFACRFPDPPGPKKWTREDWKCLAMNRSNIFFDRIDDVGLDEIWQTLRERQPYLIHGHPSTIYALACHIERKYGSGKAFEVFESSGELLEPYMRKAIERVLQCRVINRYGLAELGVTAYELDGESGGLQVLESEGWPESLPVEGADSGEEELVFTGFRNRLMPLLRYRTGDMAKVVLEDDAFRLVNVVGRIHDLVPINGIDHATHHIQDMLDHRVGGIQEFQIDLRTTPPTLNIVPEPTAKPEEIQAKVEGFWKSGFTVRFVGHDAFVRVGRHAKFRHVVHP